MTKNTWPFPDRPGVPFNPEKDGWHWLVRKNEEFPEPWEWASGPDGWCAEYGDQSIGNWCEKDGDGQPKEIAKWYSYLGPCLTPEEAAALQARADRNAAEYARVDDKARLAEFLHKQEIAAKDARIAKLERLLKRADDIANWTGEDLICGGRSYASVVKAYKNDRTALGGKDG